MQDAPDPVASEQSTDIQGPEISRRTLIQVTAGAVVASTVPGLARAVPPPPGAIEVLPVRVVINGQTHDLAVDPRQSLLDLLRETLHLTGTKKGCNQGACGACTILLNGKRVNSCLTLAVMHLDAQITTIEGREIDENLHPLQAAFIEHEGFQCGYCTSGQIMSGIGCISEGHAHSHEDIQFWMSGNICRCGAYPGICAAISEVAGRA